MHQSVVAYDVAPRNMTPVRGEPARRVRPRTFAPAAPPIAANRPGLMPPRGTALYSFASYLSVAVTAIGLVAAWVVLCAI